MGDQESPPNTRPNDSSNLYMPYMGLGPTSILKNIFYMSITCVMN